MQSRWQVLCVAVILVSQSGASPLPFLEGLQKFVEGIRYVPPTTGIFAPSPQNPPTPSYQTPTDTGKYSPPSSVGGAPAFSPVPASENRNEYNDDESAPHEKIVFKDDEWSRSYVTSRLYLLGKQEMSREAARLWCEAQAGHLAEILDSREHYALSNLIAGRKDGLAVFWLGLQKPFSRWETSGREVGWNNWAASRYTDQQADHRRCATFNGRNFNWEHRNCHAVNEARPLCQKVPEDEETKKRTEAVKLQHVSTPTGQTTDRCLVKGFRVVEEGSWLQRLTGVVSPADCHDHCRGVGRCNIWSWSRTTQICHLNTDDSVVVKDEASVSGTTLPNLGCNRPVQVEKDRESRVEYCSCVTPDNEAAGYVEPRSLPFNEDDASPDHLGRLIVHSACPPRQELVCTDDHKKATTGSSGQDAIVLDVKHPQPTVGQPNITDCLVYDVRLSTGNSIRKLYYVDSAQACHAHCLETTGCSHWTWRGDKSDRVCYLKPNEGRMVRRAQAASGTVLERYGCRVKLAVQSPPVGGGALQPKQEAEEQSYGGIHEGFCTCQKLEKSAEESFYQPRTLNTTPATEQVGQGRIVNWAPEQYEEVEDILLQGKTDSLEKEGPCPPGYYRACIRNPVVQEWQYGIPGAQQPLARTLEDTLVEAETEAFTTGERLASAEVRFPTD